MELRNDSLRSSQSQNHNNHIDLSLYNRELYTILLPYTLQQYVESTMNNFNSVSLSTNNYKYGSQQISNTN